MSKGMDNLFDLLEKNFRTEYSMALRMQVWSAIKKANITEAVINEITVELLKMSFPPKYVDFVQVIRERANPAPARRVEICTNCGKEFYPETDDPTDVWCPACKAWRDSPEGQRELSEKKKAFRKTIEVLGGYDER